MKAMIRLTMVGSLFMLAACNGNGQEQSAAPTNTLMPIVSMTPRFTATAVPTRTPLPTFTLTPSITPIPPTPSDTPTPTEVPPVRGVIQSLQSVNVRNGPGVDFSAIEALPPGTGVIVLETDPTGRWLNIRMDDGQEGWVAFSLVYIEPTPTAFPTLTPSPNLTSMAQGTPLPTAVLGGGTITPTPPRSAVTATPVIETPTPEGATALPVGTAQTPVINVGPINQTATALAGGSSIATAPANGTPAGGPTGGPINVTAVPTSGTPGSTTVRNGVSVLAYCDDPTIGSPPPTGLAAGSTIRVWWRWQAKTADQVQQHIDAAVYDVRLDGVALQDWRTYRTANISQLASGDFYVDWLVPAGPLSSGAHQISYTVTWTTAINDGYASYGPGTSIVQQTGSCNFTVR
jgi:SH3 domain-containing protein